MYDIAIIGGGISGLYCALKLNKKNNIVLFESDRIGGRIYTHSNPIYEIGAGRFNNSHKILWSLIKKYDLPTYKMSNYSDYIHKNETVSMIKDSQRYIDNCMRYILNTTIITEKLRNITFFTHCVNLLGNDNAHMLVYVYGFYSEFNSLNAYDAIKLFDTFHMYYGIKNGMNTLCECILKDLKRVKIIKEKVDNVTIRDNIFCVNNILCKKVIFTIPSTLLLNFPLLRPIHDFVKILIPMCLLRIYAIYPNTEWINNRITTNSFLRHIIPIRNNLIMISYTDGNDVLPFLFKTRLKSEKVIKEMIHKELNILFNKVPEPIYFKCHYWQIGAHSWSIGINSKKISEKVINPLPNVFICGEGFSHKQGWIEGALETSNKVIYMI